MSVETTLSPVDLAALDALILDALDTCEAAGITDNELLQRMASELAMAEARARTRAGDAQAARICSHMVYAGVLGWMEAEEAAGRPCFDTADAMRRLLESGDRWPPVHA